MPNTSNSANSRIRDFFSGLIGREAQPEGRDLSDVEQGGQQVANEVEAAPEQYEQVEPVATPETQYEQPTAQPISEEERPAQQQNQPIQQTAPIATGAPTAVNQPLQQIANTALQGVSAQPMQATQTTTAPSTQSSMTAASIVDSTLPSSAQTLTTQAASQPVVDMGSALSPQAATPTFERKMHAEGTAAGEAVDTAIGNSMLNEQADVNSLGAQAVAEDNVSNEVQREREVVDNDLLEEAEDYEVDKTSQEIIQDLGPAAISDYGVVEKAPSYGLTRKNRTFTQAFKEYRKRIKKSLSKWNKSEGLAFTGVIFADESLPPHCVSVGSDLLADSLRDPNSGLLDLVNSFSLVQGDFVDFEQALRDIGVLIREINAHDIPATVEKSPVNQRQSVQVRTLRIHPGGGIGLHPTQGKAFNADFDSDTVTVNLDQDNVSHYGHAMNYLIGIDGNPAVDMDFFFIDEITDDQVKDVIESMKNLELAFKWAPNVVDLIFKDYRALCNARTEHDINAAMRKLIYKIAEIAPFYSPRQPDYIAVSRIFKSLYDFGVFRRNTSIDLQVRAIVEGDMFVTPSPNSHPLVVDWTNYCNEVIAGRTPHNTVEFGAFMQKKFADFSAYSDENPNQPSGKNVPFRLVADFCNGFHRSDLITIGDPIFGIDLKGMKPNDPVPFETLYEITCAALQTKLMKGAENLGEFELSVKTHVKSQILEVIGLPKYDGQNDGQIFADWIAGFINEYNVQMRVLNMSNISIRNGYGIVREKVKYDGISKDKIDQDLATALLEVFNEVQLDRLLPPTLITYEYPDKKDRQNAGQWISPDLRKLSLGKFSMTNRLRFESEPVYDEFGNRVMETTTDRKGRKVTKGKTQSRKEAARARLQNGVVDPYDILFIVADKRTAKIGDYCKNWEKATKENVDLFSSIMEFQKDRDFQKYMEDMLNLMYQVSPDMFSYYGMDNPQSFSMTKHGKRLMSAAKNKSVDAFRSELVSMTIEWRLDKSSRIMKTMKEVDGEIFETPETESVHRIEELQITLDKEYDVLASASPVWHAIVEEVRSGADQSLFRKFIKAKGGDGVDLKKSEWSLEAEDFWKNPQSEKYGTLITFLKSDASYETKMAVLSDIARFHENFPEITSKNIIGYLAYNPDRFKDGSPYDMDMGIQRELDAVKGSIDRMSSYKNKTPQEIYEQHSEFMDAIKDDPEAFSNWLTRMATEKNFAVHVSTVTAADAIASVFEKGVPDKEKISQQSSVNGLFECVSMQVNGGFYTHLHQTDNKVVNVLGYDQFTYLDLIKVLGDPELELYVYDEFGVATEKPISRNSICGGDTIEDVINWLDDNPRISMQLRRHVMGVSDDVEGSSNQHRLKYIGPIDQDDPTNFAKSADELYDEVADKVFGLLSDRPRFYASCCLVTPSMNDVARNISEKANAVIRYMCNRIAEFAKYGSLEIDESNSGSYSVPTIDEFVTKTLGVTEDRIYGILNSGNVEGIELFEEDKASRRKDAHAIYMTFRREIEDCIEIVENSAEIKEINFDDIDYDDVQFEMSITSVRAFQDVTQQIGGSRTHKMLNIEGAETKKNECFKVFINNRKERFSMKISVDGIPTVVDIDEENPEDITLQTNERRQQKSIAKRLEIKRETGAEKGNAKVKKYGDDGTNSIVKYLKYDKASIEKAMEVRDQVEHAPDRMTAIEILAEALIDADIDLGYIDIDTVFVEADYLNTADLMIGENSPECVDENGKPKPFSIRTFEQLSVALRSRLDDSVIYDMKKEEQIAALNAIADVVGTDRDPMARSDSSIIYDILVDLNIHGIASNAFSVDRARRARASSVDRNHALMVELTDKYAKNVLGKKKYKAPSRTSIENRAKVVFNGLDKDMRSAISGFAYPKSRKNDEGKWVNGTDWSQSFDLIGRANDPTTISNIIPGPQSFVLFNETLDEDINLAKLCFTYGVTIGIYSKTYPANCPVDDDLIQVDDHLWIIPCFDMKLNGSFAKPVAPAPAQWKANPSDYVTTYKDITGEFGPSDSGMVIAQEFADRTHVNLKSRKPEVFSMADLFVNTIKNVNGEIEFSLPSFADVQKYIINEYELEDGSTVPIDFGVDPDVDEKGFDKAVGRYLIRMREYIDRFYTDANEFGLITQNIKHDSIIGFVKATINDGEGVVFAPIIPFPPERSGDRPKMFNIVSFGEAEPYGIDPDTNSFFFDWEFTGNLDNEVIKFYEGIGHSNKFVVSPKRMKSRTLANGWPIDGAWYHSAVASRLFDSNLRIMTMLSAWHAAKFMPEFSYNFALLPGAFPDRDDIRVKLANNEMTREDWKNELPNIKRFFAEDGTQRAEKINSIAKHLVTKAVEFETVNPSTLLCSRTEDALLEPWLTEFETFMDTSLGFEDAWLTFMHAMIPSMVPDGIYGDDSACLFKVVKDNNDYDPFGTLVSLVPYYPVDGSEMRRVPSCVFISPGFFGDTFSGIKNVQYNSNNRFLDSLNVADNLSPAEQSMILQHGSAGMSHVKASMNAVMIATDNMKEKPSKQKDEN